MISVRVSAIIGLAMIPIGLWITMRAKDEPQQVRHEVVAQVASAASDRRESDPVFHREFTVGAGGNLRVNIPDGDISVRSGSSSRVVIEVFVRSRDADWGREVFERMDFTAGVDGNTVTVAARGADVRRDEWRRNRGVGVTAQITIPARFNAQIETSDGDIRLESLEGNVSLRSSDGDIDIGEVRGATSIGPCGNWSRPGPSARPTWSPKAGDGSGGGAVGWTSNSRRGWNAVALARIAGCCSRRSTRSCGTESG